MTARTIEAVLRKHLGACCLCLLTAWGDAFAMPLTNGDFASAFDGWSGRVIFATTMTETTVSPPPGASVGNFAVAGGAAELQTSYLTDDIYSVLLFQDFELPTVIAGQSLVLSYVLSTALTDTNLLDDGIVDFAFAQLMHAGGFVSLMGRTSIDVTHYAGDTVQLLFGVEDYDDGVDRLTVGNIAITVVDARVAEPATVLLIGMGMAAAGLARRVRNRADPRHAYGDISG